MTLLRVEVAAKSLIEASYSAPIGRDDSTSWSELFWMEEKSG